MKTKTKKIKQYSILALAATAVIPMSCSKDTEPDDPNITARTVSLSVVPDVVNSNKRLAIDIDANGTNDLGIASWYSNYASLIRGCWIETSNGYAGAGEVLTTNVSGIAVANFVAKDTEINSASTTWNSSYGYVSQSENSASVGTADNVDRYIGVRFKITGDTHYGWMKVKVSNSGKTLTVSELAYNTIAGTGIKAGAK